MNFSASSVWEDADRESAAVISVFEDDPFALPIDIPQAAALREAGVFRGKAETCYFIPGVHDGAGALLLGLGEREAATAETLRRAGGQAAAVLRTNRVRRIALFTDGLGAIPPAAFVEGVTLGQYAYTRYKAETPDGPPVNVETAALVGASGDTEAAACAGAWRVCANANWARDLANTPGGDLRPAQLVAAAQGMAEETGLACEVLDEAQLTEKGMGALTSVAQGSEEAPWLVCLEHKHAAARETLCLVGKGITFDTGGVNLKPGDGMWDMKHDMCGAAAVLGAIRAIAQEDIPVNVAAVIPIAENMPSGSASRPGDIVRAYNGKTIEVRNTDAEGRLILADALAYAAERFAPDHMVDIATLTGAAVVALGHFGAPVMASADPLFHQLEGAAAATGERIWRLPAWEDYNKLIEGVHSDLCNIGPRGEAGTIVAGMFLKHFTGAVASWSHIDIAGMAWNVKHIPYWNAGDATGFGVRLLAEWAAARGRRGA